MKKINSFLAFLILSAVCTAQPRLSLQQAIELGIKNNLQVNQAAILLERQEIQVQQSRALMLPDLNASIGYGQNQGRSIDPFTNSFVNKNVSYSSMGAGATIILYNGGSIQNKIKEEQLARQASRMEWQQAKDNVTINIILAYLQILSSEETLQQVKQQGAVTNEQASRLEILNSRGAISPSQLYDVKGQVASEQIAITDQETALYMAKLNLCQLLNIPFDKNLQVEPLQKEVINTNITYNPDEIYAEALQHFSEIKAVEFRTESARKAIKKAQGSLWPTLYFSRNIQTNYSSAATRSELLSTAPVSSDDYVEVGGIKYPVMVQKNEYEVQKLSFESQLKNNFFGTSHIGLSIPIFNKFQNRNQVKYARLELKNRELLEKNVKTQVQQAVEDAYVRLMAARQKYSLLTEQVAAFEESFRAAEIRFNVGDITSVDYLIAKNNLDRARIQLIIARFDFLLREQVLNYYRGKQNV